MKKIMFNDRYGLTQAVIEGRKTVTRRIVPSDITEQWIEFISDAPNVGGVYVHESEEDFYEREAPRYNVDEVVAVAQSYNDVTREFPYLKTTLVGHGITGSEPGCTNKMYVRADLMPHQIRITGIRCERLQDISAADCMKEGVLDVTYFKVGDYLYELFALPRHENVATFNTPQQAFAVLIDKVSSRGTWQRNPWVVVYEFELIK